MPLVQIVNLGASANPDINSAVQASSFVNISWTPPTTGALGCFVVSHDVSGPKAAVPSMSGNGVTWERVRDTFDVPGGEGTGITAFLAAASASGTGTTTVTFPTQQDGCIALFWQALRADLSGGAANAVRDFVTDAGLGIAGEITFDDRTLVIDPNGAVVCVMHWDPLGVITFFEPEFEKLDEVDGAFFSFTAATAGLKTSGGWPPPPASNASWTPSDVFGVVGLELKAEPAGLRIPYPSVY